MLDTRFGAVLYAKDIDRVAAFYSAVLGLKEETREEDHVVLSSRAFQLVVLKIPPDIGAAIEISVPPKRRAMAAVKPVFFVSRMADVRASVEAFGGVMSSSGEEWSFQDSRVCDGLDPEGNVIQFREPAGTPGAGQAGVTLQSSLLF